MLAVAASNGQDIVAPFNVVITGGSKGVTPLPRFAYGNLGFCALTSPRGPSCFSAGVGKALATEFLKQGDNVVICSRQEDKVKAAVNELSALAKVHGGRIKVTGRSHCLLPADGCLSAFHAAVQAASSKDSSRTL